MRALAGALLVAGLVATAAGARTVPTLRITQKFVGSVHYIEGSIGYIRIQNRVGRTLVQKTFRNTSELRFAFMPGIYRIVSFQRPCDANCGYLDRPTDRCKRSFQVRRRSPSVVATVLVSPGNGCKIRLRTD